MYASARTFSFTFAASLGLHGLLLLAAAAFMTVVPDFGRENSRRFNAVESILNKTSDEESEPPQLQEVEITFLTEAETQKEEEKKKLPPEAPPKSPVAQKSGEKFVYAPEDRPSLAPLNPGTPFISSQNMRAASTSAPTPGADPNLINQEGRNLPFLSLKNSAFSEGREAPPPARQEPPQKIQDTPPPPKAAVDPVADPSPASKLADSTNQRPPEPANTVQTSDPLAPAASDKPPEPSLPDTKPATTAAPPALREKPLEPVAETKVAPPSPRPRDPVTRREESKNGRRASLSSLKTKSTGAVAEQGEASVDARDTAEGRYGKIVHDVINPIWNRKLAAVRGLTGVGVVEVSFEIDIRGKVSNVRLVDPGKANPVFEDVCLTSIIQAKLPPPPDEMQEEMRDPLSNGKLRRSVSFFKQY